ncbi:MAG: sugar phosphate isomerase/epimerase family protein [Patescibacteria group bacterium]|nr:sugar phosphate isomerase/epimerase family protein [Patescibacteria group bacterium]
MAGLPLLAAAGAGVGAGVGARAGLAAEQASQDAAAMGIGIATFQFRGVTNAELAKQLSDAGFHTIQLFLSQSDSNYWRYNSRNDLSDLTPERCKAIAETYRQAGIAIHSMGVYTNLIHPDPEERSANLAYFDAMMQVGRHMGVATFITEAGHYRPEAPSPGVPYDFRESTWDLLLQTFRELGVLAQRNEATVLIEPSFLSFFASAKRTRVFLEQLDCPQIRVLLDPANLIELNDLDEMFTQLAPWIDCLHAKDRKLHTERGVAAGEGDVDYVKFVSLAAKHTPTAPLILEYVDAGSYQAALAHLRGAMREAGLRER